MAHASTRTTWRKGALCAVLPVLWLALVVAGPASAQTNSPSGGQGTGQAPSQGDTGSDTGPVGGDGEVGNRTTPGGGGATGGGASGAGTEETANAGSTWLIVGVVVLLAAVGVAIAIGRRHRRVMEDAGAGTPAAR